MRRSVEAARAPITTQRELTLDRELDNAVSIVDEALRSLGWKPVRDDADGRGWRFGGKGTFAKGVDMLVQAEKVPGHTHLRFSCTFKGAQQIPIPFFPLNPLDRRAAQRDLDKHLDDLAQEIEFLLRSRQ